MKFLLELEELLKQRKEVAISGQNQPTKSYTVELFTKGLDRILKKVGEEAGEVIIAAKNSDEKELIHEVADLIFHLQVVLVEKNISIRSVEQELINRHK
jgi:phosphoribosyl-ATP pyrophosphohydrolase